MPMLGNVEYHLINDGIMYPDGGGAFGLVPKIIWAQRLPPDELNRIPFSLNCLLIRSEGQTILVDTGYGTKLSPKMVDIIGLTRSDGDVVAGLARLGIAPEAVTMVINTHLHGDHCSGNTKIEDGLIKPAFPNAEYWVQRLEFADAITTNERTQATYFPDNYLPLYQTGQLKLMSGDTQVTSHVRTAVTRGHTRAHQVVIIESQGETAVFVADLATLHYHLERLAWVTGYDVEPLESIETKRYWQQWLVERDALILFQHDTEIPVGRLKQNGRRFKVVPA